MYKTSKLWWPLLLLIDFVGYLFFGWQRFFSKKINPDDIKKILIIRLDNIGDVVVTTPSLRALRKRFSKARIDILIKGSTKELLDNNSNIDKVIVFDPPWHKASGALNLLDSINFFLTNNKLIKKLRSQKYDLAIEFHTDPRNILLMYLINAKRRIGHSTRGFGFLLTNIVSFNDNQHIIKRHLDISKYLGCNVSNTSTEIFTSKRVEINIKDIFLKEHISGKIVCLNPGTGRINKYWPNKNWSILADKIIEKYNATILFTGSKDDLKNLKEITNHMKFKQFKIFAGKLNIIETAALIKRCNLFISTDTGPMHIAKAVGIPLIGLFGPVNPEHWGYKDEKSSYVSGFDNCSCKYISDCIRKTDKYKCMKNISIRQVLSKVSEFL